jgi:hypothetical protein
VLIRLEENGMKLIEFPSVCVAVYRGMRWASRERERERERERRARGPKEKIGYTHVSISNTWSTLIIVFKNRKKETKQVQQLLEYTNDLLANVLSSCFTYFFPLENIWKK